MPYLTSFFSSKFKEAIGLSIDGMGDFNSCVISKISGNKYSFKKMLFSKLTRYILFRFYSILGI